MKRLAFSWFVLLAVFETPVTAQDLPGFDGKIKPFIKAYCTDCHGPDVKKAGLRLDTLGADLTDEASLAKWIHVHDKVAAGKMPPPKREQPPKAEAEAFTKWLHE